MSLHRLLGFRAAVADPAALLTASSRRSQVGHPALARARRPVQLEIDFLLPT